MEALIQRLIKGNVGIGSVGEDERLLLRRLGRSVFEEIAGRQPGRRDAIQKPATEEEADTVNVDRPVIS